MTDPRPVGSSNSTSLRGRLRLPSAVALRQYYVVAPDPLCLILSSIVSFLDRRLTDQLRRVAQRVLLLRRAEVRTVYLLFDNSYSEMFRRRDGRTKHALDPVYHNRELIRGDDIDVLRLRAVVATHVPKLRRRDNSNIIILVLHHVGFEQHRNELIWKSRAVDRCIRRYRGRRGIGRRHPGRRRLLVLAAEE